MKLSIVIPALDEVQNIASMVSEIQAHIAKVSLIHDYEIIVVDDHSTDQTFEIIQSFADSKVRCIRLSRRSGSHVAIRAGLNHAKGDAVLCISADGQDDPSIISEMLKNWKNGSHVIWAIRKEREESLGYKLMALSFYFVLKLLTSKSLQQINLSNADFFLLDRKVVCSLINCGERNTSLFGLISWIGFRQDYVEYDRRKRSQGTSKWNFHTRMRLATDWIVAFSGLPLRLISLLGFVIAIIGFVYAIIIAINSYTGHPPQGWSETIILILILSGFQMMIMGIIGEYLWKNLDESRQRPLYFIEQRSDETI